MPPTEEQLTKAYEEALRTYGERPQVSAVDVGHLYREGQRTTEIGVRVHVRGTREKSAAALAEELRPLQPQVGGVPLHFMEGVYRAHADAPQGPLLPVAGPRRSIVNPLRPGVSVSHARMSGGTLGLIVFDAATGRACALGNAHVLAGPADAVPGDAIVQPARDAGGRASRHTIGALERILDDTDGDAAIALLDGARQLSRAQWDTNVVVESTRAVRIGDVVEKSGARTGTTRGIVDGRGRYYLPALRGSGLRGVDGFKIVSERHGNPDRRPLSGAGDSGAVWYAVGDRAGVGLHVAGEVSADPQQEHAIACHLHRVLQRLDVTLAPPAGAPNAGAPGAPGAPKQQPRRPLFNAPHALGVRDPEGVPDADAPPGDGPHAFSVVPPVGDHPHALLAERVDRLTRLIEQLLHDDGARPAGGSRWR